ncbi:hypothetical protein L6R53_28035 [Myxococcota bacterium]|nr:hypothetical protein [Myxococcota bacterium]
MRRRTLHPLPAALLLPLAACAWTPPRDPDAAEVGNSLAGTLVYGGEQAPGDVIVLLYAADDPPPPLGTGRPVDFSTVPAARFTGEGAGLQSATWSLADVPDGQWLVSALMDLDGDFQPLLSSQAGATCGDVAGGHLADLVTGEPGVVEVGGGELLDDLTLVLARTMPIERPAFTLAAGALSQVDAALAFADPADDGEIFTVQSTAVSTGTLSLTGPFDGTDACDTAFWVHFVDEDGDGQADPHPEPSYAAMGLPMAWPRLYLEYLGETLVPGERWVAEAVVDPLLQDAYGGAVPLGVATPLTSLRVAFVPAALHLQADGSSEVVSAPDLPVGPWSVTVVAETGQTWTLPNDLATATSADPAFDPASQGAALELQ